MPFSDYTFPPYSFLQGSELLNALRCEPGPGTCLPLTHHYYLSGSMLFQDWNNPNPLYDLIYYLTPVKEEDWVDCIGNNVGQTVAVADYPPFISSTVPYDADMDNYFIPASYDKAVFFNRYHNNFFEFLPNPIEYGDCFRWLIIEVYVANTGEFFPMGTVIGCTNCFIRSAFDCYQAVLRYGCNEDSFSFPYSSFPGLFYNIAQMPLYLKFPQFESEEDSYRKSDGTYKKLYERTDEVFELETDWLPYPLHKNIKVALGSDQLNIEDFRPEYNIGGGDRVCTEQYQIDWQDNIPYRNAMGNVKIKNSVPVSLTNSNCSTNG